jgi:Icc-related predicted phosphoesterase
MKKFTIISDTHGKHGELNNDIGSGDFILHSGDVSNLGKPNEILSFLNWFGNLDFKHKIFIAGNHDFAFEENNDITDEFKERGIIYLMDNMIEIDNVKIYGSPWQPTFHNWAFNVNRGEAIAKKWELIPHDMDIVMTHGPVFGILDYIYNGRRLGCEELYKRIMIVRPKYHICGHIHYARGYKEFNGINFFNAAVLGENYEYINKPIVFILDDENKINDLIID